ncbi:MAG: hypothetical protein ACTHJH_13565 [Marmoricola sp.]
MGNLAEWSPDDPRRTTITLRKHFVADGYNDRALARLLADGTLARPRRGAYVAGSAWRQLDNAGKHAVRARAVLQMSRLESALSHVSAALEYDAPSWHLNLEEVDVTRLNGKSGRREAGVRQHRGVVVPGDVVRRNGIPVMSATRVALEVTTVLDVEASMGVVSHLLHHGLTTPQQLADRYALMETWPHTLRTDLVLRRADPRLESLGEARTFYLLFRHGFPLPQLQHEVRDETGRVVARLDFAWPSLGIWVEFDGKIKYEKLLKEGERASDVVLREKRREAMIERLTGWKCIRLTWTDVEHPAAFIAELLEAIERNSAA